MLTHQASRTPEFITSYTLALNRRWIYCPVQFQGLWSWIGMQQPFTTSLVFWGYPYSRRLGASSIIRSMKHHHNQLEDIEKSSTFNRNLRLNVGTMGCEPSVQTFLHKMGEREGRLSSWVTHFRNVLPQLPRSRSDCSSKQCWPYSIYMSLLVSVSVVHDAAIPQSWRVTRQTPKS